MLYCMLYYLMHTLYYTCMYCTGTFHSEVTTSPHSLLSLLLSIVFSLSLAVTRHDSCEFLWSCHCYAVYLCLLLFRSVRTPSNGSAVLLTEPAQITHGLHDHHMRKELPPKEGEHGVTHWPRRSHCGCLLIQLPHVVFSGAAGEELDIGSLVPWNTARKHHRISLCNRYGMHVIMCMYMHNVMIFLTCVVQDVLNNVLNLLKSQVVLWPLACVSMHPHSWPILEVTLLNVLEPLDADVVEEQEGTLANTLALVVELAIRSLPLFRTGAVVALQGTGLIAVSHDLSHHKQVQLIVAHLSEGGSEGLVVFQWEQHGAWCLPGSEITTTPPTDKLLNQITLLVVQVSHHCCHITHLRQSSTR